MIYLILQITQVLVSNTPNIEIVGYTSDKKIAELYLEQHQKTAYGKLTIQEVENVISDVKIDMNNIFKNIKG